MNAALLASRCALPGLIALLVSLDALGEAAAAPRALPVPGHRPAAVLVPSGAGPLPLVIGLHGNFDRPEWFCGMLQELVGNRAYALCPRGRPRPDAPASLDRWTFPDRRRVRLEIEAGIKAMRGQPAVAIDDRPVLLAGFSLGAILASRLALESSTRFPRLYLVEGGQTVWTAKALAQFARSGGRALLFGCGRAGCTAQSERICREARALELGCEVVSAKGLGHSYTDPLPALARAGFLMLLEQNRGE